MKKKIIEGIKVILFLGIALLFLWLAYRNTDLEQLKSIISNDVNYWWIGLGVVISIISHLLRAVRWQQLIETIDKRPSFINATFAVFIAYFANLAVPRMGEISRCGVLTKYENINFSKTVGTVVSERVVDMLFMLLVIILSCLLQLNSITQLFESINIAFDSPSSLLLSSLAILGGAILLVVWLLKTFPNNKYIAKINLFLKNIWLGMKSVKRVRQKGLFTFYTLGIWLCYFLMNYVAFFAFDFTSSLSMSQALLVFSMGSIGMVIPAQGGIGTWHKFTIATLVIMGVGETQAGAFAFIVHASFTLTIIIAGFISIVLLPLYNRKTSKQEAK